MAVLAVSGYLKAENLNAVCTSRFRRHGFIEQSFITSNMRTVTACRLTVPTNRSTQLLFPQQAQAIAHHQQAGADIGEHGHPHGAEAGNGEGEEDGFDGQRQHDVLHQHGMGGLG